MASYNNPWTYCGRVFESDDVGKHQGFVYCITHKDSGRMYIGKKFFHSIRKVKGKKRRQRFESDWKEYYGSSVKLLEEIAVNGHDAYAREILSLHLTRGQVNYHEVKQQFMREVLESTFADGTRMYYNDNIAGKWWAKPAKEEEED